MCLKLLQDSCSEAMIRLFVFFLNFLFIIVGVVLACIGIWMEVEYTKIEVRNIIAKVMCIKSGPKITKIGFQIWSKFGE